MSGEDLNIDKEVLKKGFLKAKFPDYKINKPLIFASFVLVALLYVYLLLLDGFGSHAYVSCPGGGPDCPNPYGPQCSAMIPPNYCQNEDVRVAVCNELPGVCGMALLPAGFSAGDPPSELFGWFPFIALFIPVVAAALNHVLYNRGGMHV